MSRFRAVAWRVPRAGDPDARATVPSLRAFRIQPRTENPTAECTMVPLTYKR